MVVQNAQNNRWTVIAETNPSGVTNVVHTGTTDFDWLFAEYYDLETSSAGFIFIRIGQEATPVYRSNFYISHGTGNVQYFSNTVIYPEATTTLAVDRRAGVLIPNMSRKITDNSSLMKTPFSGGGWSTAASYVGSVNGVSNTTKEPITAIRYATSAGNLQGTGAVIRTWGYR